MYHILYNIAKHNLQVGYWFDLSAVFSRLLFTVFLSLMCDGFQVFIQALLEQIVFNIKLLLSSDVHRIYTQI